MIKRSSPTQRLRKMKPFIKGFAAGVAVLLIFSVVSSLIFYSFDAPQEEVSALSYFTLCASCFVCGMFVGGGKRKNGFISGAAGGLLIFLLCLAGAVVSGNFTGGEFILKLCLSAVTGCIGGIVGVNLMYGKNV